MIVEERNKERKEKKKERNKERNKQTKTVKEIKNKKQRYILTREKERNCVNITYVAIQERP